MSFDDITIDTSSDEPVSQQQQQDVEFLSGNILIRGWIRLPTGSGPHPLVVLAHGMGGLKEWTIPDVATALVDAGIAALAFDYRNFGDSDGMPRDEIDHCGQIEDFRSAISFATTLAEVDPERIGIWGTSLGGRNVLAVAALDRRVKCVLSQVPALFKGTPAMRAMMATGTPDVEAFNRLLAQDRRDRALGKEPIYLPVDEHNGDHAAYWSTFGEAERRNFNLRMTLRSFEPTVSDDVCGLVKTISPTPLRMILTDRDTMCDTNYQLEVYATALEPKSLMVLPGNHYALYLDGKEASIAAAREWFVTHLKPETATAA
jgi:dienelactone hydrolase